jgi:1,4-alpha-glucan branching enzyme
VREVFAVGSFNGWNPRATPLQRDSFGDWSVTLQLPPEEYRYRLIADGEWRDDPLAQRTATIPFGGFDAVIVVEESIAWIHSAEGSGRPPYRPTSTRLHGVQCERPSNGDLMPRSEEPRTVFRRKCAR